MPFNNPNSYAFTQLGIANAPNRSGVYGIFKQGVWIYIGEAGDIQARPYDHLNGNSDQSACILAMALRILLTNWWRRRVEWHERLSCGVSMAAFAISNKRSDTVYLSRQAVKVNI